MRAVTRIAAVLLCAFGMAYPTRGNAQSAAPIELKWSAREGCPSAEAVLARVRKIAGTTRATPTALRADATITQPSDGLFRLRLEIQYGNLAAVRNIEGKSCKDLAGAAAVALALLLSSEEPLSERDLAGTSPTATDATTSRGSQAPAEQATPQEPRPASVGNPEGTTPTLPSAEGGSPRRWRGLLVAPLVALGIGPMKRVSRGFGGAAGVSFDHWRFLAEAKFWASQHETISNLGDEYDVELNRSTVGARACRSVFGARFEVAPCVLMSVHHLSVRGSGPNLVPGADDDAATWAAVGIGAEARLLITPWLGLVAGLDGELQLSRPEVSVSLPPARLPFPSGVPVERLAPVAATITVGSQWIF
jgi:hypothetical protein